MSNTRTESDSIGPVEVQADKYWGARSHSALLEEFRDRMGGHARAIDPRAGHSEKSRRPDE